MRGLAIIAIAAVAVLTACEEPEGMVSGPDGFDSFYITSASGRKIECIRWNSYQEGGLSCDWEAK